MWYVSLFSFETDECPVDEYVSRAESYWCGGQRATLSHKPWHRHRYLDCCCAEPKSWKPKQNNLSSRRCRSTLSSQLSQVSPWWCSGAVWFPYTYDTKWTPTGKYKVYEYYRPSMIRGTILYAVHVFFEAIIVFALALWAVLPRLSRPDLPLTMISYTTVREWHHVYFPAFSLILTAWRVWAAIRACYVPLLL